MLLFFSAPLFAQDSVKVFTDTLIVDTIAEEDTLAKPPLEPGKVLLRSAWLPGFGQFSNGDYWKVPLAAGGVGFSIYNAIGANRQKEKHEEAFQIRFNDTSQTDVFKGFLDNVELIDETFRWQANNRHALLSGIYFYGMNLFDAYASAVVRTSEENHYPVKAAFYSALLPGLGQVYNKKYWKVPIVLAALGTAGYFIHINNRDYQHFAKAYLLRTDEDPLSEFETEETALFPDAELLQIANDVKLFRDYSYLAFAGLYLLNIVDAIVDAHLYDFDLSDDLSFNVHPYFNSNYYGNRYTGLSLSFHF